MSELKMYTDSEEFKGPLFNHFKNSQGFSNQSPLVKTKQIGGMKKATIKSPEAPKQESKNNLC